MPKTSVVLACSYGCGRSCAIKETKNLKDHLKKKEIKKNIYFVQLKKRKKDFQNSKCRRPVQQTRKRKRDNVEADFKTCDW